MVQCLDLTVHTPQPRGPDMGYCRLTGAPLEPSHAYSMPQRNSERHFCAMCLVRGIGRVSWGFWPQPLRVQPGLPSRVRNG